MTDDSLSLTENAVKASDGFSLDPAIVEAIARAGFVAAAANAAREYGLGKPVTWDEHLTGDDREHELIRTRAMLTAAAPLIAAKAWDEGFKQGGPMHDVYHDDPDAHTRNPYRADAIEAGQS